MFPNIKFIFPAVTMLFASFSMANDDYSVSSTSIKNYKISKSLREYMKTITAIILLILSTISFAKGNIIPNNLVQLIIDSKELNQYWHPEQKNRVPLTVLNKHIEKKAELSKFGQSVDLISQPSTKPYFEIVDVLIDNEQWTIKVQYAVEGITGIFVGKMQFNGQWILTSVNIIES